MEKLDTIMPGRQARRPLAWEALAGGYWRWPSWPKLSELRNALRVFENYPGTIGRKGTGGFAVVHDSGIRPERYARTTPTTLIVTHDVPPFVAVDVAMPIGDRRVTLVHKAIVSDPQDVPDLMRN